MFSDVHLHIKRASSKKDLPIIEYEGSNRCRLKANGGKVLGLLSWTAKENDEDLELSQISEYI